MRVGKFVTFAALGSAVYAAVRHRDALRRAIDPVRGSVERAFGAARHRVESMTSLSPTSVLAGTQEDPFDEPLTDRDVELQVQQAVGARPMGADVGELVNADADLVEAERELLTTPGSGAHRRRDQTAGIAAQEVAAAQVRARRNGVAVDELDQ